MGSRSAFLAVIFIVVGAFSAWAQTDRATLEGTVTDASGAVVRDAKVRLTAVATAQSQERMTNSNGHYRFPGVAIGFCALAVSRDGFKTEVIEGIELHVGETHTLDVKLAVGGVEQRVEVKEDISPSERSSAESATVVGSDQIDNLPINGRNWATLTVLAPWAQDDGGGDQRTIRFAGRGRDDNNFSLDGVDATGIQEQAQKSQVRLQISEDAIEEYRVSSALYDAEYGSQAGGQIDVVTKSGTNDFHGDVFGYLRNSAFDARAFNDPSPVPPFRLGQYGLAFGGPIVKNKTFFFLNYEGLRQFQSRTLQAAVPDAPLQQQILAQSPVMCSILQAYPWRQSTAAIGTCAPRFTFNDALFADQGGGIDQFTHEGRTTIHEDTWLVRLDHKFTDKTSFYGRAQRDIALSDAPLGAALDRQRVINHPANYLLALQHVFSTNIVNEVKFGINRSPFHNPQASVFPLAVNSNDFEGLNNSNTDNEVGTTFSWVDNLTWTHGRSTFKAGIEIRRVRLNQGITADNGINYTDQASLISNTIDSLLYRSSWCCHGLRRTFILPYFQDEWKVTPTLTLNLGIRWEYYGVAHEAHDRTAVFDLQNFGGVCVGSGSNNPLKLTESSNCPRNPSLYERNYRNWDPRASFAWAPSRFHEKTVIRGGFGMYHGAAQNDDLNAALESDNVRVSLTSATASLQFGPGYLQNPPDFGAAPMPAPTPRALFRRHRDLYAEVWGLTVQQALPANFLFTTSYLGTHGVRLFARSFENTCIGDTNFSPTGCQRPLPQFGAVDVKQDVGTSSYHGLLLSLQRRITNGWSFQANYTYSHSINDGSIGGGEANASENVQCRSCDRGPSVFDIRHNFVLASVYEFPIGRGRKFFNEGVLAAILGGWNLSAVGVAHTGHPLTVLFGPSASQIPDGNDGSDQRPDVVPGVPLTLPGEGKNGLPLINGNAFQAPPHDPVTGNLLRFGNAGRGLVRAPGYWQIDMSLVKETKLTERFALQFGVQAFNIFNHTPLGDPGKITLDYVNMDQNGNTIPFQTQAAPDFGLITSTVNFNNNNDNFAPDNVGTGLPRQLQFVLKLRF